MWKTLVGITFVLSAWFVAPPVFAADTTPSLARQREIIELLREDCGSCHGMTLKGGLGPPLTPQALADKPADMLRATILNGRAGTPMAPWRPFLSDTEAAWLTGRLKQGITDGP
jgi:cytochrome c55X